MPSLLLPPFPVVTSSEDAESSVQASAWEVNGRELAGDTLGGWDYSVDLQLRRTMNLSLAEIREQTGIGSSSSLRVVALWSTGAGYEVRECGFSGEVSLQDGPRRLEIEVTVPGTELASALVLNTLVVLERRAGRAAPGSARDPGDILWRDDYAVTIEGEGPRMPVLVVDIDPDDAAWAVRTRADWLDSHPSVGVHVLINKKREDIVKAVHSNPPSEKERMVRSAMLFDVGRQLVERALDDEGFDDDAVYAPNTCGLAMSGRVRSTFGRDISEVRLMRNSEPEEYNAALQAGLRLFILTP